MKNKYQNLMEFIGRRAVLYLAAGLSVGIALFATEISFAYCLQTFLATFGVIPGSGATLPSFFPSNNLALVLSAVFMIGSLRACLQWAQLYLAGAAEEHQKNFQRLRVVEWAFASSSVSSGEIMNIFTDQIASAGALLTFVQNLAVLTPVCVLLWIYLAHLSLYPTLVATTLFLALGLGMKRLDQSIAAAGNQIGQHYEQLCRRILTNVKNLLLMQIYGTREQELERVRESIRHFREAHLVYLRLANLKYTVPQIFGIFLICVITLVVGKSGPMPSAVLVAYFYLFVRFVQAIADASKNTGSITFYGPRFFRLLYWWQAVRASIPPRRPERSLTGQAESVESLIGWRLRFVRFAYSGASRNVFEELNLEIQPGSATAFVGPSGVGKSTLIQLLLGTIAPTAGTIEIYSAAGQAWPLPQIIESVILQVGYVGAESFLIEGSIRENLIYGLHQPPSESEISFALQGAECQFALELGLSHNITEQGQGLSAGQKQRLSLARALLRRPKVLILDEATANLDSDTEQRLIETFAALKGKVTIVIATHRQAMVTLADEVISLDWSAPKQNSDKTNL
jgi:ABC-type transport system involved in cytochrome bd biosynthesis fused ATPase/permease subunit